VTRAQQHPNGSRAGLPPVPSIPLSKDTTTRPEEQSLGELVREATAQISTLVRAEVELAKMEVGAEVRKGLRGSVYFILALAVLMFSVFFLFFTLAELLNYFVPGLPRFGGYGIVFLLMLATAGFLGYRGFRRMRGIRAPERTISTVRDTAERLRHRGDDVHHSVR
jgi:hypothetical protein